MKNQVIYTVAGVISSFMIVFCGWILTNTLLDKQEAAMLASSGSVYSKPASETVAGKVNGGNSYSNKYTVNMLKSDTISKILENWNTEGGRARPHDPVNGQLEMTQAIISAKNGLSYFGKHGIIPSWVDNDELTVVNASLCENPQVEKYKTSNTSIKTLLPPEYSYWSIRLDNKDKNISANLQLNAVTGEIWRADILSHCVETTSARLKVENIVEIYESYLGLKGGNSFYSNDVYVRKGYEGFYVVAEKNAVAKNDIKYYNTISFYLSSSSVPYKYFKKSISDK